MSKLQELVRETIEVLRADVLRLAKMSDIRTKSESIEWETKLDLISSLEEELKVLAQLDSRYGEAHIFK